MQDGPVETTTIPSTSQPVLRSPRRVDVALAKRIFPQIDRQIHRNCHVHICIRPRRSLSEPRSARCCQNFSPASGTQLQEGLPHFLTSFIVSPLSAFSNLYSIEKGCTDLNAKLAEGVRGKNGSYPLMVSRKDYAEKAVGLQGIDAERGSAYKRVAEAMIASTDGSCRRSPLPKAIPLAC